VESTGPAVSPDLRGKPLRQALATLAALRTDVELDGHGVVVQQIPPAGSPVVQGASVRLTLAAPRGARPVVERSEGQPAGEAREPASPIGASAPGSPRAQ
jgi:beta-lactam-binding protein with PASTA domain